MLAAIAHPLTSLAPVVTASNYHDGWSYQGGAFEQWLNESGTSGLARDTLVKQRQKPGLHRKRRPRRVLPGEAPPPQIDSRLRQSDVIEVQNAIRVAQEIMLFSSIAKYAWSQSVHDPRIPV
jgi:hypothetical protein